MDFSAEVYNGKSMADIFSDVDKNSRATREQIHSYVTNLVRLIKTAEDAAVLGPTIQGFLAASIKNDEQLLKIAQIAQRLMTAGKSSATPDESGLLTEEEKKKLLGELNVVVREMEDIEETKSAIVKQADELFSK